MEIEAVGAPEGSICAAHPQAAAIFVCSRCGNFGCEHCVTVRTGEAMCSACGDAPVALPERLGERLSFLYLSLDGRIDRRTWWLYLCLPSVVFQLVGVVLPASMQPHSTGAALVSALVGLLMLWPWIAMAVKRLHDRGQSAAWLLLALVPMIGGIWLMINLGFMKGDVVRNQYGPAPA